LVAAIPTAGLLLLAAGAVLYTVGVGFHLSRLPFQNATWHACVLLAAMCHYVAIVFYVAIPFMSRDLTLL
jgi:hemolysin III